MRICCKCKKICKKTPYGSCVILCKENKILCIDCNSYKIKFDRFKQKCNLLKFIKEREIITKKYI